jgi:hypothetical protein
MSNRIDDPIDASDEAWPEEPEGLGKKFGELALSVGSLAFKPGVIVKILKDQFLPDNRFRRIKYLLGAVHIWLKELESQIGAQRGKVKEIQSRIEGPQFQEAVATACEEAARATDKERIDQFAAVLVGSLLPSSWADPNLDLATLIRDLAQLGTEDIRALDVLRTAFRDVIAHLPNLDDPNQFAEHIQDYTSAIGVNHFDPEDFYAACARLNGFGLAIEVVRNPSRMRPHEYLFRPTRRGLTLLDYLERFPSSERAQSA